MVFKQLNKMLQLLQSLMSYKSNRRFLMHRCAYSTNIYSHLKKKKKMQFLNITSETISFYFTDISLYFTGKNVINIHVFI